MAIGIKYALTQAVSTHIYIAIVVVAAFAAYLKISPELGLRGEAEEAHSLS